MKKKNLTFLLVVLLLCMIGIVKVNAAGKKCTGKNQYENAAGVCVTISSNDDSERNKASAGCNTGWCGNTFNERGYSFFMAADYDTPIYGIRVTLLNKNGKIVSGKKRGNISQPIYLNLWATQDMYDAMYLRVGRGASIPTFTNFPKYSSDATRHRYIDGIFSKKNDLEYVDGKLEGIKFTDNDDDTTNSIMDNLKKINVLKNVYELMNCYGGFDTVNGVLKCSEKSRLRDDLTFDKIVEDGYYIKVEPIIVFYLGHNGKSFWFQGTVREIATSLHNTSSKNYSHFKPFDQASDNCKVSGNGSVWNVLNNFITGLYLTDDVAGYKKVSGNGCHVADLRDDEKLGWGKSIIELNQFTEKKDITVNIEKLTDSSVGENKCYDKKAYFKITNKTSNITKEVGADTWCDGNKSKKESVTFNNVKTTDIYEIVEYSDREYKHKVEDGVTYKMGSRTINPEKFQLKYNSLKISVYNKETVETCESELSEIKKKCPGGECNNTTGNRTRVMYQLYSLYGKYKQNLLLNFNFGTKNGESYVDISNVACGSVTCTADEKLFCSDESSLAIIPQKSAYSKEHNINTLYSRVCYQSSDTHSQNLIGYLYEDYDADCDVSYSWKLSKLKKQTVKSGQLLWRTLPGINDTVGQLNINVECSKFFTSDDDKDTTVRSIRNNWKLDENVIFGDLAPSITISQDSMDSYDFNDVNLNFEFSKVKDNVDDSITNGTVSKYGCDGNSAENHCYAYWNKTYIYNVLYENEWYTKGLNGIFINGNDLEDTNGYINAGGGFPIPINTPSTKSGQSLSATLTVSNVDSYGNKYSTTCPYEVDDEIFDCPSGDCDDPEELSKEFNFDFRVIDTSDPFPGAGGNNRLTGSNWCADANIGKIKQDSAGKYYMIGDFTGSGTIESDDVVTRDKFLTPIGDIDGDGVASYDTNCTSSSSDYCVLKRYVGLGNQSINCNSSPDINNIVKRYITNAKNSYSTDEPMYSFTLTSQDIKNIRDYNKLNAYDDYNMKCLSDDKECLSTFLTDWIKNKTVNGVALSASAQASVNNASCYETRVAGNWCSNH